ncbi:DUF433 domain-containing protein [Spirosoma fluviale]|uniref:Uncharacterized conserved protein, DUF433 family n=1 Tax=Spirosoma fluviale TaxID=1597977 RepID=A0A286FYN8_9BACT|nr:DUF433 domain-containing protein [Spirosoma fluviale]SOD88381.1 Uncharacterized conserved protein, DUF433 family [Spirosoma fluviale]
MNQIITIHPDIQSGTPVFFNTRVPVKNLFDYVKGGHTVNEFIDDFPSVKYEQALAVLDLAVSTVTLNFAARA